MAKRKKVEICPKCGIDLEEHMYCFNNGRMEVNCPVWPASEREAVERVADLFAEQYGPALKQLGEL